METVAAPQLINPIDEFLLNDTQQNRKQYEILNSIVKNRKLEPLDEPYMGAALYNRGTKYFVLDHQRGKVAYYMQFDIRTISGKKAAYQVIVWSDRNTSIAGYASKVFFEILLTHADVISTDRQQTPNGQRFWFRAIDHALKNNMYVYYMNRNTREKFWIENERDLEKYEKEIWINLKKGMGNLVIISPEPI